MSSSDLQVVVEDGEPPVKPSVTPEKQPLYKNRKAQLAGAGLLAVLLVPAVVAPAVVVSNNKKAAQAAPPAGSSGDPDYADFALASARTLDPTSFNATALNMSAPANGTVRVPRRTFTTNLTALTQPEKYTPFVKIAGGQFDEHCRPFYPVGFNAFELTTMAATGRKADVDAVFKSAAMMGMTAARTWAHSITKKFPFQTGPGTYDQGGLEALDYVIASASRHGVRLILSFIDNWKYYNGVDQYVDWCGPARTMPVPNESGGDTDNMKLSDEQNRYETIRHATFFKEEACKKLYRDNVDFITSRKNSINGLAYKDDPTILAWNLINEPRCETWVPENSACPQDLTSWFQEMADYVRSVDPNHLVTSGSEGFFGPNDPMVGKNPQAWGAQTGQNFVDDNRHMDFAVTHAWPDNWFIPNERQGEFLGDWLDAHLTAAESIGKPLLFEEFGKKLDSPDSASDIGQLRDPVYAASYRAVENAIEANRPLLGSLYWKWAVPGMPKGPYDVDLEDSTMGVIRNHAGIMHRLVNAIPPRPSCVLPASPDKDIGAWFASAPAGGKAGPRGCVNSPEVSLAFYLLYGPGGNPKLTAADLGLSEASVAYASALAKGQVYVYPTKADCCRPSLGAYPNGCTV